MKPKSKPHHPAPHFNPPWLCTIQKDIRWSIMLDLNKCVWPSFINTSYSLRIQGAI